MNKSGMFLISTHYLRERSAAIAERYLLYSNIKNGYRKDRQKSSTVLPQYFIVKKIYLLSGEESKCPRRKGNAQDGKTYVY